jgi:hypothetical protein
MLAGRLLIAESLVQTLSTVGWMITAMLRLHALIHLGVSLVPVMLAGRLRIVEPHVKTQRIAGWMIPVMLTPHALKSQGASLVAAKLVMEHSVPMTW